MSWKNQSGGPWGGGGGGGGGPRGPWGSGPSSPGPTPPDIEDLIRRSQDQLRTMLPGSLGGKGLILLAIVRGILAADTRCCICYQPLFLHRPIAKSRLAPVFQPFGIHSTAALLSLCARSLRCPYCGRVNRLSKDK